MCVVAVQRRAHICFGKLDITLFFRLFVGLLWCMLFNSYLKVDKCFKKIQCFIISTIICFHQIFFHRNLCSSKKFHQKNSRDENEASTGHPASSSSHTASVNLWIMFFLNLIDFHNENQNNLKLCETSILVAPVARIAVTWNHHWNFIWEIILSGWYDMIWYVGDNYHWNFISEIILSGWYIWPLFNDLKSFRWHWKWIHG